RLGEIITNAQELRAQGKTVLVCRMNKNKKFQKEQLTKEGYTSFTEFYREPLKN
ncbi:MAG: histidine--tRNA ligase, partial [Lachnospiraceae bacterium]|nr:histidine--tRNA ligase [Lachnospiraceae bacterium]